MNNTKQAIIDFYLDWVNNYLTYEKMAEHYEMDVLQVHYLICIGREWHEQNVGRNKALALITSKAYRQE